MEGIVVLSTIISDCIELNGRRLGFKTAINVQMVGSAPFISLKGRGSSGEDELGIARHRSGERPKLKEEVKVRLRLRQSRVRSRT